MVKADLGSLTVGLQIRKVHGTTSHLDALFSRGRPAYPFSGIKENKAVQQDGRVPGGSTFPMDTHYRLPSDWFGICAQSDSDNRLFPGAGKRPRRDAGIVSVTRL